MNDGVISAYTVKLVNWTQATGTLTTLNDAKIFISTNWLRRVQGEVTQPSTVIAEIQSAHVA